MAALCERQEPVHREVSLQGMQVALHRSVELGGLCQVLDQALTFLEKTQQRSAILGQITAQRKHVLLLGLVPRSTQRLGHVVDDHEQGGELAVRMDRFIAELKATRTAS